MRLLKKMQWASAAVLTTLAVGLSSAADAQDVRPRRAPIVSGRPLAQQTALDDLSDEGVFRLGEVADTASDSTSYAPRLAQAPPPPEENSATNSSIVEESAVGETQQVQFLDNGGGALFNPVPNQVGVGAIYDPFVDMTFYGGNFGQAGQTTLFLPLLQDSESLLFTELDGLFGNAGNIQGSFGLGYRQMLEGRDIYVGANAFYDYRQTGIGTEMHQLSFGGEVVAYNWDARLNGYISDGTSGFYTPRAFLEGNRLWLDTTFEQSYSGADAEGGALLLTNDIRTFELRAYTGAFYFEPNGLGNTVAGPKGRLEARMYDLPALGSGSRLVAGVEATWDRVRDTQWTGMAQLRIPLGGNADAPALDPFSRRMLDRVVRERQIVTQEVNHREPVANKITGVPIVNTVIANPGTFAADVNAAGFHSLVIANGAITTTGEVDLFRGQSIIGGGSTLPIVGTQTGTMGMFTAPGMRPTITSTNPVQAVFRPDTDTVLMGLDIAGGAYGVDVHTQRDMHLIDLNISGSGIDGIRVQNGQRINIRNSTVSGATVRGIFLRNMDGMVVDNVMLNMIGDVGLHVLNGSNLMANSVMVNGTGVGSGIFLQDLNTGTLSNTTIMNTGFNGMNVLNGSNISMLGSQISGTTADGIRTNGTTTFSLDNTSFTGIGGSTTNLTNSSVSGSGNTAVPFSSTDGGGNTGTILFNGGADSAP
ncbi:MAG: right-handed parallel beta-helix repeat-containing protein [Planctomycetaceae bacterium]